MNVAKYELAYEKCSYFMYNIQNEQEFVVYWPERDIYKTKNRRCFYFNSVSFLLEVLDQKSQSMLS